MGRRTVTLFIPTLTSGGAERVTLNLATALADLAFQVTILVQRREGQLLADVPENVRFMSLDSGRSLASLFDLIKYIRREKPEIFISNLGHANIISLWARALSGCHTRLIVCQHCLLSAEVKAHKIWQYKILPFLYRIFLPLSDAIVAVSAAVAKDLVHRTGISFDKITTIYNPIVGSDFMQKLQQPQIHQWFGGDKPPVILGVGRLAPEKDFATLIKSFALLRARKSARLLILGEGPLQNDLQKLIDDLGLTEDAQLLGFQPNPLPYMRDAAIVVLSSRHEGLSNVLIEALACGTQVISTDSPGGHREILNEGEFGLLVPPADAKAMADALMQTLDQPKNKEKLRQRGRAFTFERAAQAYVQLFECAPRK